MVLGEDRNSKQIFPEEILKTILESGQLDAVVAYKHEAISRGLPYITLPKEINLSDPLFSTFYKKDNYTSESGLKKHKEGLFTSQLQYHKQLKTLIRQPPL